jgi:hypothetical protein
MNFIYFTTVTCDWLPTHSTWSQKQPISKSSACCDLYWITGECGVLQMQALLRGLARSAFLFSVKSLIALITAEKNKHLESNYTRPVILQYSEAYQLGKLSLNKNPTDLRGFSVVPAAQKS